MIAKGGVTYFYLIHLIIHVSIESKLLLLADLLLHVS